MTDPMNNLSPAELSRPWRGTKIIATLGPATDTLQDIIALAHSGADVFRLNFSHGSHEDHQRRLLAVREAEQTAGRPLGVLADLQGPKLRIGRLAAPVPLEAGMEIEFAYGDRQSNSDASVPVPHEEVFRALAPDHVLLVDDGRLRFRVKSVEGLRATLVSETDGILLERKGINLPHSVLPMTALTPKDLEDLAFAMALGVDWVALSFVQSADDIAMLREIVGNRAGLIAKIEKPSAIEHLRAVLEGADAVMIARGDLGVEMPAEDVPALQRRIIRSARELGRPVIVATQMMESMISHPTPTRAEVSDVATAVYESVDAVMLSAESASGRYPKAAVDFMARIIERVEADVRSRASESTGSPSPNATITDAISLAVRSVSSTVELGATVTYTRSGASALRVAHVRSRAPLIGLTPDQTTARRLALVWGVRSYLSHDAADIDEMVSLALVAYHKLHPKAANLHLPLAIVAGMPFGTPGATNTLRLVVEPLESDKIESIE
jgi:pyruvate kinase